MKTSTAVKIVGVAAFGYLCAGAGAMVAINRDYKRAAHKTGWVE